MSVQDLDTTVRRLAELRSSLEASFSLETAAPGFVGTAPSTGQCAAASVIVRDILGGDFVSATVHGQSHWFNRLRLGDSEIDVDITGDQFGHTKIRWDRPNLLYSGTRLRRPEELDDSTLERARLLATRSGLAAPGEWCSASR